MIPTALLTSLWCLPKDTACRLKICWHLMDFFKLISSGVWLFILSSWFIFILSFGGHYWSWVLFHKRFCTRYASLYTPRVEKSFGNIFCAWSKECGLKAHAESFVVWISECSGLNVWWFGFEKSSGSGEFSVQCSKWRICF